MTILSELYHRLFPRSAEMTAVMAHVEELEEERAKLKRENAILWENYNAHDATVRKQREAIDSLKAKLREQNDADLLLVSARITIAILKGNKPEQADLALQHSLAAQQQSMRSYTDTTFTSPYLGSMLSSLGMANIFGR